MPPAEQVIDFESCVERILAHGRGELRIAAPLGLGKPNALLNALYRAAKADAGLRLDLYTALSLAVPAAGNGLKARFITPFLTRQFGDDYPDLEYVSDEKRDALPANVRIHEFYLQSGALMDSGAAQRDYVSENYTHVARDLLARRINVIVQMVAARGTGAARRYSLSCNPDVTLDLLERMQQAGQARPLMVGVVHPELPFMGNNAEVPAAFFDLVHDMQVPAHRLFALPREPVDAVEHAIGYHASTLVQDGGTLQIGIGALSDALVAALLVRHQDNGRYREIVDALTPELDAGSARRTPRHRSPFRRGLYGASEMVMDGFMHLRRAGILVRQSFDDMAIEQASAAGVFDAPLGSACTADLLERGVLPTRVDARQLERLRHFGLLPAEARLQQGAVVCADQRLPSDLGDADGHPHWDRMLEGRCLQGGRYLRGAFFLGSKDLYRWLRQLEGEDYHGLDMTRVSDVNQLYGGRERLDALQRRGAAFFNTCMMATLLGAAVSDQLEDGRVVSGVGGQFNFVAMAHELDDGRSVLLLHATRDAHGRLQSNIRYNYGHTTVPRHMRDIYVTEYGIADLRGQSDQACIKAMLSIADARFIDALAAEAREHGKLARDFRIPDRWRANTPEHLAHRLAAARRSGHLSAFPLGCDFDALEQRLLPALAWLEKTSARWQGRLGLLARAAVAGGAAEGQRELLERMRLHAPASFGERVLRRVLLTALRHAR